MTHRISALIILLSTILTVNAYDFKSGGLCYNINSDGKTATVTHENDERPYYTSISSSIIIPSSVTNSGKTYTVTTIGNLAFAYCGLTAVSLPSTITTIESGAFYFNYNLTSITIPNAVTSIQNGAFYYCALKEVTIPANVKNLEPGAFQKCEGLTTVKFNATNCDDPDHSVSGLSSPFSGCTKLQSITIGSNVKRIPNCFCYKLSALTKVTIPNSVTEIADYAFNGCTNLSTATLGSGVKTIGDYSFENCSALTSITIPNSTTKIGGYAFKSCSSLTTVTLGASVTFGTAAFWKSSNITTVYWNVTNSADLDGSWGHPFYDANSNIKTVVIGNNVKRIPGNLCRGFSKLANLTIGTSVTEIGEFAFGSCYALTSLTIPNSVASIGRSAFNGCTGLSSLSLGSGVKTIDEYAFAACRALTNVKIPNSVTSLAQRVFYGCDNLATVSIGSGVTTIGTEAFSDCAALKAVTIPASVTSMGDVVFTGCTSLATVNWNAANCADFTYSNLPFKDLTGITTFNFGNTVKYIPAYLCYELSALTRVTLSGTVKTIGYAAFSGCAALTQVNIPASVTLIDGHAFYNCSGMTRIDITDIAAWFNIDFNNEYSNPLYFGHNLYLNGNKVTHLTIPSTITSIKPYTLTGCSGLARVTIPASLLSIGSSAFNECTGLTRVDISDINAWLNIDFDYNGNPLFYAKNLYVNNELLTSLVIPNSITAIKKYTFYGCESLTSLTIPNSVTSIGYSAFNSCTSLISVLIPGSITTLGDGAFRNCTSLNTVVSKIVRPQDVDYTTTSTNRWHFHRIPRTSTLYVPKGSLADYQAQSWGGKGMNPWRYSVGYYFGTMKEFVDGDVNEDEKINVGDVSTVYGVILGTDTDAARSILSDLNEDGMINVGDISKLYLFILGE